MMIPHLVYIQVFDGKSEQIPILWSDVFSLWYSEGLWDRLVGYIRFENRTYLGSAITSYNVFCLACQAEARHMYCFSGVVVVVVVGGGVNFFAFRSFSRNL